MAHIRKRHKPECATRADARRRCNCNGAWQARIPDPLRGSTHKIERTFRTKQEADEWIVSQRAGQQQGTWVDPRKSERKFAEVVDAWKESWPNRIGDGTASLYEGILATHVLPTFASAPVGKIDRGAVQRWVNQLTADGLAPGTVRNAYACLRNALNTAVRYGWIRVNPCASVDLPRQRREEMLFVEPGEIKALAEKIDKHYKTALYVAAYTGLRAGELWALRRRDVDLLRGTITVARALKDVNGVLSFGDLKTDGSRRTITLPASIKEMLRDHLESTTAGGTGPEALVFASKTGKPIRHRLFVRRHFRRAVAGYTKSDGTKVPGALPAAKHGLRWHDLRHTSASLAINAGAHPLLVSKMLGHSSVQITLDRYSHLFPNVAEALAEKLEAIFVAASTTQPADNVQAIR